jgi:N-acetylneuraminic acid mutarotase
MKICSSLLLIILVSIMNIHAQSNTKIRAFTWEQTKQLPDPEGFAGLYAGISDGALIVAGGSNFPGGKRPWDNATKVWYDNIFVLKTVNGDWSKVGKLPKAMGYGVALTYKNSVICVGGGDAKQCYSDVFSITFDGKLVHVSSLPSLPEPLMNACGVIGHDVLYILGGIKTPTGETQNNFWSLDLKSSPNRRHWKILANLPGKSRMLATAGSLNGDVYLFGGAHLFPSANALQREYLKDCWVYKVKMGKWKQIDDMPYPLVATPSPAYASGSHLSLFGGDDGYYAQKIPELKDRHPGFRNEILSYDATGNKWSVADYIPVDHKRDSVANPHNSIYAPVTTPLVIWHNKIVIAGGEARPGVRSNRVLVAIPKNKN